MVSRRCRAAALGFQAIHLDAGQFDGELRLDDPALRHSYLQAAQETGVTLSDITAGYLNDFAVYHHDLARWLGGEVRQTSVYYDERNGGCAFAVALQFENGAVGNLQLNSQRVW